MSDENALLNAIIAQPDEDTPRLVYADWLDEHEAPIQAEFIRVQCRLAACSAADADYPDLLEHYEELIARFQAIAKMTVPELPPGFAFESDLPHNWGNFRRGFLFTVKGVWEDNDGTPSDEELEQFHAGLPKLIATTTARRLSLMNLYRHQLAYILTAPGIEAITGLEVNLMEWTEEGDAAFAAAIAASPCARGLEVLSLGLHGTTGGLAPLAAAKFPRLEHLKLPTLNGGARPVRGLIATQWFQGLRSIHTGNCDEAVESILLAAFAKLPGLESLHLGFFHDASKKAFASPRGFPALSRLALSLRRDKESATPLTKGRFPQLTDFDVGDIRGHHLATLLKAKWFPRLRVLTLRDGQLNDKSVIALSKSPVAANLRSLRLINVPIGSLALAALGDGTRFPNLTTLWTTTGEGRKVKTADIVKFVKGLNLPHLRHLDLTGWPLGDAGAKALAANASLAGLTQLLLHNCGIGEQGLTALVRSPHLQQLIELGLANNKLKTASALRATKYLPRLAAARLEGNAILWAAQRKLHAVRGLVVE